MASIANWVIIPVIITSITFIRLGIIIITLINIILLSTRTKSLTMKPWNYKVKETPMITRWVLRRNVSDSADVRVDISFKCIFSCLHVYLKKSGVLPILTAVAAVHWLNTWWPGHESKAAGEGRKWLGGIQWLNTRKKTDSISAALHPISPSYASRNWSAADQWPQITNTPHWRPHID